MRLIPNFGASLGQLPAQRLLGTGILSASALLLEIALTRLFSLIFFPPYVFLILSVTILGIGIGAAATALRPAVAQRIGLAQGSVAAALFSILLLLFAVYGSPVDLQIPLFILLALPYICVGLVISLLFSEQASASRILYMSDLVGAGCGALLAIPLLNRFGAVNAILLAALGFSLAGLYFSVRRDRLTSIVCLGICGAAFAANVGNPFLEIDPSRLANEKPIVAAMSEGGSVLRTRWDAFARTDLVDPGAGVSLRRELLLGGVKDSLPGSVAVSVFRGGTHDCAYPARDMAWGIQ